MFSLSRTVRAIFVCVVHTVYCILCVVCGALCVVMLDSHQWNTTPGSWRWYESVSSAAWKLPPTLAPSLCAVLLVSPLGPYPDTQRPDHNQRHTTLLGWRFYQTDMFYCPGEPGHTCIHLSSSRKASRPSRNLILSSSFHSLGQLISTYLYTDTAFTIMATLTPRRLYGESTPTLRQVHADSTPSPRWVHADHIPQWAK